MESKVLVISWNPYPSPCIPEKLAIIKKDKPRAATKPNMRKIIPINGLMILPSTIKMRLRISIKYPKTVPMPANIFRTIDWLFSFVTVSSIFEATARPMVPAVTGSPCISKWSNALSASGAMTQRIR